MSEPTLAEFFAKLTALEHSHQQYSGVKVCIRTDFTGDLRRKLALPSTGTCFLGSFCTLHEGISLMNNLIAKTQYTPINMSGGLEIRVSSDKVKFIQDACEPGINLDINSIEINSLIEAVEAARTAKLIGKEMSLGDVPVGRYFRFKGMLDIYLKSAITQRKNIISGLKWSNAGCNDELTVIVPEPN